MITCKDIFANTPLNDLKLIACHFLQVHTINLFLLIGRDIRIAYENISFYHQGNCFVMKHLTMFVCTRLFTVKWINSLQLILFFSNFRSVLQNFHFLQLIFSLFVLKFKQQFQIILNFLMWIMN